MPTDEPRRMLLRLLTVVPAAVVAARCGVHKSQVSRWASGLRIPRVKYRAALASYGIPAELWAGLTPDARNSAPACYA